MTRRDVLLSSYSYENCSPPQAATALGRNLILKPNILEQIVGRGTGITSLEGVNVYWNCSEAKGVKIPLLAVVPILIANTMFVV